MTMVAQCCKVRPVSSSCDISIKNNKQNLGILNVKSVNCIKLFMHGLGTCV